MLYEENDSQVKDVSLEVPDQVRPEASTAFGAKIVTVLQHTYLNPTTHTEETTSLQEAAASALVHRG